MDKKKVIRAIKEHIWGPVGSVVFHVLLFFIILKLASVVHQEKVADVTLNVMEIKPIENMEQIKQEVEKIRKIEDVDEVPDRILPPDVNDLSTAMQDNQSDAGGESSGVGFGGAVGFGTAAGDFSGFDVVSDASSPLVMKGLYEGRSSGGRGGALAKYGGAHGRATESAVIKALEWLKNHQNPNGSWGPNTVAMTGLGLLTFLAHGETTGSKMYGHVVRKAIDYLCSQQKDDGQFGAAYSQPGVYAHAIAAYAIAEAYGLCRIPDLKPRMEKSIGIIVKGQQPGGLWDYEYKKAERRDLSVSGWQVQALKAANINGAEVPGLHEAIDKAMTGVKSMQGADSGRFGYSDAGKGSDGVTGVGVLSLQLGGKAKDRETALGVKAMAEFDCDWKNPTKWPMYAWYYITQAKFQAGGGTWNNWNSKFAPVLTKNQADDGHWDSPVGAGAENEETKQGPVYSTCLAALTLQVYYRFLPTYAPVKVEEKKEETKDDVSVDIT